MQHAEMVALIRGGIVDIDGVWAEMGAGTGNFTYALRDLLATSATIYAIDRDGSAFVAQQARKAVSGAGATVIPRQADFAQRLTLPPLDGLLMANALHFVRDQEVVLARLVGYLKPGGRVLLVEYALDAPLRYVPYPVGFARFAELAAAVSLSAPQQVGFRRSPSSGVSMYAAVATKIGTA